MARETDRLTFNQFQKQLRDQNIDPRVAYFMSMIYEQHMEVLNQVDVMANIVNAMADQIKQFVDLHAATQQKVNDMNRQMNGGVEGVTVSTEPGKGH